MRTDPFMIREMSMMPLLLMEEEAAVRVLFMQEVGERERQRVRTNLILVLKTARDWSERFTSPSVNLFPTGPLAMLVFAEFGNMTAARFRAVACRPDTCKVYMKRLQVIIQFVDEIAAAARRDQVHHLMVLDELSRRKVLVLNRLLEVYQRKFQITGMYRGTVWMILDGTQPVINRAQQETAVRRAVCETRFTFKQ